MFIFQNLTGTTFTLPSPVLGTTVIFLVGVANTSNTNKIITDASTTFLVGGIYMDKALTITRYDADGTTIRSINLDGTGNTKGGNVGDYVTLRCISATQWMVEGTLRATGTLATPFATS